MKWIYKTYDNNSLLQGHEDTDKFYIDGKRVTHDDWCEYNKYHKIEDTVKNHSVEELKLSVRIAKHNIKINPSNKYYLNVLERVEKKLINEL